ncbi:hypothetical protein [Paraburkholderia fynbosensis]|nr:hypothetical protein [Paraburkholderia fynbosensis]
MIRILRVTPRAILGVALLFGAHAASCANLGFLNDTPMSYMKQPDIDSIKKAAELALNTKSDGESAQWRNEGTGNSVKIDATLTPGDTEKHGDMTCRFVAVVLNAKGQSMSLHPQYCRSASGPWQLQRKN